MKRNRPEQAVFAVVFTVKTPINVLRGSVKIPPLHCFFLPLAGKKKRLLKPAAQAIKKISRLVIVQRCQYFETGMENDEKTGAR